MEPVTWSRVKAKLWGGENHHGGREADIKRHYNIIIGLDQAG